MILWVKLITFFILKWNRAPAKCNIHLIKRQGAISVMAKSSFFKYLPFLSLSLFFLILTISTAGRGCLYTVICLKKKIHECVKVYTCLYMHPTLSNPVDADLISPSTRKGLVHTLFSSHTHTHLRAHSCRLIRAMLWLHLRVFSDVFFPTCWCRNAEASRSYSLAMQLSVCTHCTHTHRPPPDIRTDIPFTVRVFIKTKEHYRKLVEFEGHSALGGRWCCDSLTRCTVGGTLVLWMIYPAGTIPITEEERKTSWLWRTFPERKSFGWWTQIELRI